MDIEVSKTEIMQLERIFGQFSQLMMTSAQQKAEKFNVNYDNEKIHCGLHRSTNARLKLRLRIV